MSEFNEYNWKTTLTKVYLRSIQDPEYRQLCLSDPYAAIKEISDIEMPAGVNLQFFDNRADYVYAFLLPPVPDGQQGTDVAQNLIDWSTLCTDITTTHTGPNQ